MTDVYLILDMQNDLVHPDGGSGRGPLGEQVRARKVVANTAAALSRARAAGVQVGFVRVGFSADYREVAPQSPVFGPLRTHGLLKLGTWGAETHQELPRLSADWDVVKHRVSPFFGTPLDLLLRATGVKRIFCSGVSTQAVVQATVRDAHDRDYEVVLLEDCCAAPSAEEHANSVQSLSRFCRVIGSAGVFG